MAKTIHRGEYNVIRDLLREKRVACGLTQVEVSQRMGRSQSFVSDVERGTRRVDLLELRDLCDLFGIRLTGFCEEFERRAAAVAPSGKRPMKQRRRSGDAPAPGRISIHHAEAVGHKPPRR